MFIAVKPWYNKTDVITDKLLVFDTKTVDCKLYDVSSLVHTGHGYHIGNKLILGVSSFMVFSYGIDNCSGALAVYMNKLTVEQDGEYTRTVDKICLKYLSGDSNKREYNFDGQKFMLSVDCNRHFIVNGEDLGEIPDSIAHTKGVVSMLHYVFRYNNGFIFRTLYHSSIRYTADISFNVFIENDKIVQAWDSLGTCYIGRPGWGVKIDTVLEY